MKTEEKIVDKVLDTLIDEASAEAYRKEADYNAPEINFSPEHERNMQKLFRKERHKYNLRRATVVTGKVACFVILLVAITVLLSPRGVEALKTKFLNFFYDKDAPDMEITFTETKQNSYSNDMVHIGYISNGFKITLDRTGTDNAFLKFKSGEKFFQLYMSAVKLKTAINTEKGTLENIKINNHAGVYIVSNGTNVILWNDGVYTFRLAGNIDKEELIKIAKTATAK